MENRYREQAHSYREHAANGLSFVALYVNRVR